MTIQETFDQITKHMTAEQALMKLLEGHVRTYEHLKFNEGEEIHPLILITMAATDMGWDLAIPNTDDDEEIQGVAIGTPEYFEELFSGDDDLNNNDNCDDCDNNDFFYDLKN
jgi:hypothetical protein